MISICSYVDRFTLKYSS